MTGRIASLCIAILLAVAWPGAALRAQGVYVTKGANGPVFSDKPQPGAREVTLPPINVMEPVRDESAASGAAAGATAGSQGSTAARTPRGSRAERSARNEYNRLAIVFPEDGGSMTTNVPIIDVRVMVDPALRVGDGDGFVVALNGRTLPQRYTASEFTVAADFLGDIWGLAGQTLQLDVTLVDAAGAPLIRAQPVRFTLRPPATLYNPHRVWPIAPVVPGYPVQPVQPVLPVQPIQPIQPKPPVQVSPPTTSAIIPGKSDNRKPTSATTAQ